jgi:hydrogenase maturation protease
LTNSPTDRNGLLVIGYGNLLRGDDGAGPAAAELLREHGFEALAVHQLTPELAERIAAASAVFFLDADAGMPPGEVRVEKLGIGASAADQPMEHHGSPTALLRLTREVYGSTPDAWLIAMGGESFELVDGLSEIARRAVTQAVAEILSLATN